VASTLSHCLRGSSRQSLPEVPSDGCSILQSHCFDRVEGYGVRRTSLCTRFYSALLRHTESGIEAHPPAPTRLRVQALQHAAEHQGKTILLRSIASHVFVPSWMALGLLCTHLRGMA
jgi:hypothetical protein